VLGPETQPARVSRPDLSVVVVTHGGRELALATLRSARAAATRLDVQWLVVDSGSGDGTPDAIERELPDVTLFRRPNLGFAAANNVALPHASGRYLLLLNPDVEVATGEFRSLVRALDDRPEVGVASVIQLGADGGVQHSIRRFPSPARQLGEALFASRVPGLRGLQEPETRSGRYGSEQSVDWLVGAFLAVRREALEDVGPLDDRFFLYTEEADWCYRFRRSGWDVRHLPVMSVTHHAGEAPSPDLFAQNSHSKLLFAQKHFSRGGRAAFRTALVVRHALRLSLLAPHSLVRRGLRERVSREWAALRVVVGASAPPFQPVAYEPTSQTG
jgi:GT2 family glycosyltransferase